MEYWSQLARGAVRHIRRVYSGLINVAHDPTRAIQSSRICFAGGWRGGGDSASGYAPGLRTKQTTPDAGRT